MHSETAPRPVVIERHLGGWLAVSAPDETLRLGVVGDDERDARAEFDRSASRWVELATAAKIRDGHA